MEYLVVKDKMELNVHKLKSDATGRSMHEPMVIHSLWREEVITAECPTVSSFPVPSPKGVKDAYQNRHTYNATDKNNVVGFPSSRIASALPHWPHPHELSSSYCTHGRVYQRGPSWIEP